MQGGLHTAAHTHLLTLPARFFYRCAYVHATQRHAMTRRGTARRGRFLRTALDLDGNNLVSISTFNLTRTLGDTCAINPAPGTAAAGAAAGTAVEGEGREERADIWRSSVGGGAADAAAAATGAGAPDNLGEETEAGETPPLPSSRPPTQPSERRIVGACFHELKARAMAVAAGAALENKDGRDGDRRKQQPSGEDTVHDGGERGDLAGIGNHDIGTVSDETAAGRFGGEHGIGVSARGTAATCHVSRESTTRVSAAAGADGVGNTCSGVKAVRALEPWLLPLVTRPAGFLIEVDGAVVRAGHGRALGKRLDSLALQTKGLALALAEMPGRCDCATSLCRGRSVAMSIVYFISLVSFRARMLICIAPSSVERRASGWTNPTPPPARLSLSSVFDANMPSLTSYWPGLVFSSCSRICHLVNSISAACTLPLFPAHLLSIPVCVSCCPKGGTL